MIESPNKERLNLVLKKSLNGLLRYFISNYINPILVRVPTLTSIALLPLRDS